MNMKKLDFVKYTSFGNNFVLIDEINRRYLKENEKSAFAHQATNMNFGVGSDNFLVIQRYSQEVLRDINTTRQYWNTLPDQNEADYIFRMFEPDGTEAYCCANGLMCIASYLYQTHKVAVANILTEVPTVKPGTISMGTDRLSGESWINLGKPRRVPAEMINADFTRRVSNTVDVLPEIEITFRKHDLSPFSKKQSLNLKAYLVYTGEPHLVVFTDHGWSIEELPELLFINETQHHKSTAGVEKRVAFGTWLINHIGFTLNKKFKHVFPAGININFVNLTKRAQILEYRTFERNLKETLSCGTGALAAAYVAKQLNLITQNEMILYPHRCRWEDPFAEIAVKEIENGWILGANPVRLFDGRYNYRVPAHRGTTEDSVKNVTAINAQEEMATLLPESYADGKSENVYPETLN